MDGHLADSRGGKKGRIRPMIRFLCIRFSAARVATGFVVSGANSRAPIAKPFFVNCSGERIRAGNKCKLLFDGRIEFLPVSHGPGLRLEAILLRRATMIIMITTNRTPAMIRIVVGSIEALSLDICDTSLATS